MVVVTQPTVPPAMSDGFSVRFIEFLLIFFLCRTGFNCSYRFPQPPNERERDHTVVMKMTLIFPVTKCVRCSGRRVRFFVPVEQERGYFYLLERFVTRLELDGNDDF